MKPNIFNPEERDFLRNATFPQLEERYGPLETWRPPNEPLTPPVEDSATEPLQGRSGAEDRLALARAEWLISQIYNDLPSKRDWLNPDYEREMKDHYDKTI